MDDPDLTPKLIEKIQQPMINCWNRSPLKKIIAHPREVRSYVDNFIAISYCLDRDDLVEGAPELRRLIHRTIDTCGRSTVCKYLAKHITLI